MVYKRAKSINKKTFFFREKRREDRDIGTDRMAAAAAHTGAAANRAGESEESAGGTADRGHCGPAYGSAYSVEMVDSREHSAAAESSSPTPPSFNNAYLNLLRLQSAELRIMSKREADIDRLSPTFLGSQGFQEQDFWECEGVTGPGLCHQYF